MTIKSIAPFSSGSEAMDWYSENCERCTKAYFPKDGEYPSDKTMKAYCRSGKECKLKYQIDFGFITGEIPIETAMQIGYKDKRLSESCMMFSDNDNDKWQPPKNPKPDNTPDNQMAMPFIVQEIGEPKFTVHRNDLSTNKEQLVNEFVLKNIPSF